MLRTRVSEVLREQLPAIPFQFHSDQVFAILRGHPSIGDLILRDDGNEVTLGLGTITHHHFNPYDSSLTESDIAEVVGAGLVEFINALVSDEVLMWKETVGGSGGCREIEPGESLPRPGIGIKYFLRSGPIHPENDAG